MKPLKNDFMNEQTKETLSLILRIIIAVATAISASLGFASCNVTRVITTQSSYWQKGDTTCTIQTKTTEMYDASKKSSFNN